MLSLSHVLFKVSDLHKAVSQLQQAGFNVEYGTQPQKAYNAMIWLDDIAFVEIYQDNGLPWPIKLFMRLFGYKKVLERMNRWQAVKHGWCEWCIEPPAVDLSKEIQVFRQLNRPFTTHHGKRKSIYNQKLSWHLIFPNDNWQPFIMSVYTPDPRPEKINHPNGITTIDYIVVGKDKLDMTLLDQLGLDYKKIKLVEGKTGLQTLVFKNTDLKIEAILS